MSDLSTIGTPVGRVEGRDKVTGRARYTADISLPGTLWGAVLRSPLPHARILRVDSARARALAGVRAVLTGQELGERLYGQAVADIPVLAYDRVRFIGDPIAAVAAGDRDTAEEALGLIDVEYEPLPAVFDPFEAMQPGAPLLHPRLREYRRGVQRGDDWFATEVDVPDSPNLCSYDLKTKGDVERGFREAELVLEHRYYTPIQHHGYLEPHACLVSVEPAGTVRIWASNKAPFSLRGFLARDLGLPRDSIIVEPTLVGGDFGGKGSPMQIPLAYFLAVAAGRPVRLAMDMTEEFVASNPRHAAWITIRSGLRRDGTLVARQLKIVFSGGAYAGYKPQPHARLNPAGRHGAGVYRIPHVKTEAWVVYTNHVPGGLMRSPGSAQSMFACEVDIDRLAEAVGMDPLEFRLRNGVVEGDLGPLGHAWTSVRLKECLEAVRTASGWGERTPPNVGRGVAVGEHGPGPGGSSAEVRVHPDGSASLFTGVNDQGSGAHTILVQIVGRELQLPLDRVRLVVVGTDSGLWDRGTFAMSVTHVAGQATLRAASEARDKLVAIAAEYLGCPPDQVELVDGTFHDREQPGAAMTFADLASRACRDGEPVTGFCRYEDWDYASATSFMAQVAEVEVDPETGQVRVRRVVAANDVGTILNPIGVTGQLEGGLIMGLGFGTMEELRLADGRVQTIGLRDYKLPTMRDVPALEHRLITSGPGPGPYGAKGVAELSQGPLPAAIANAVYDAVGVRIHDLPITAEKVYRALKAAGAEQD